MFHFTNNKMENKFINILNAGWTGNELYTTMKGQRAWQFTNPEYGFIVSASYNKKTGKLKSINGGEVSIIKFISDTEETVAAQAFLEVMVRRMVIDVLPEAKRLKVTNRY